MTRDGVLDAPSGEEGHPHTQRQGSPILVAGIHTLMRHGLIDEYRLMIFSVSTEAAGACFPRRPVCKLAGTRMFGSGVAVHSYHPGVS